MKKVFIVLITILTLSVITAGLLHTPVDNDEYAYLFVYFKGNEDLKEDGTRNVEEAIFYAVSLDGYSYKALNNDKPVLISNSGTGGTRDPFIFKTEEGDYVMLATDMHARYGWGSNRSIITWRSKDLINWEKETVLKLSGNRDILRRATAAWAPQAIFDHERGEYMIYFSADKTYSLIDSQEELGMKCIYKVYTKDFTSLTSPIEPFFEVDGEDVIDADIIIDQDGIYRMFYKTSANQGVMMVSSNTLNGEYKNTVEVASLMCEGSNAYKLSGKDKWVIMTDLHWGGWWGVNYALYETLDFETFRSLDMVKDYSLPFNPRHGYVITISREEYQNLIKEYNNGVNVMRLK
ncbi:MAG: glycoside hydrolase family 43 protein [Clostridia bacterium]|nr:glycoside hydrolase family 43 protein [Clostridia bacterium]